MSFPQTEQLFLWFGSAVLIVLIATEILRPSYFKEGFEMINYDTSYFATFAPKRGDIGPEDEEGGYTRDDRYFHNYANVQRLGVRNDFCRMVINKANPEIMFFACALAGTENMSSVEFRTPSTRDGFKISRDDYMRDMNADGREDYCRILKSPDGTYKALCNRATDKGFDERLVIDANPPDDIKTLLTFYEGCAFWYRFRDDMVDYVNNTQVLTSGGIKISEKPLPPPNETKGVEFNGSDQFLRIGDSPDLELGYVVPLRSLRAISCWVFFDEFTNNAHFIDFGNGAGRDNIVLGILGRGDSPISAEDIRPNPCLDDQSTLPSGPSGQQFVTEMSPQRLMETTPANVDEYTCTGFDRYPRKLPPSRVVPWQAKMPLTQKATFLYEVWDKQQRKMRIKIESIIPKKRWTHIVVTAVELDSLRPTIKVYVNGEDVYTKASGFLPQASTTTNNYFGKSNWTNDTSQYENKDELFKGSLFDVRGYKTPMNLAKIQATYKWGKGLLGQ